jgi:threonylcarbamoyladenosine tRNA methylthiotransferase MtaB
MAGKVPFPVREQRSKSLISLSEIKHREFCISNQYTICSVLFEHARNDGMINGFTQNYIKVEHPWDSSLAGKIKRVKLGGISLSDRMTGELTD